MKILLFSFYRSMAPTIITEDLICLIRSFGISCDFISFLLLVFFLLLLCNLTFCSSFLIVLGRPKKTFIFANFRTFWNRPKKFFCYILCFVYVKSERMAKNLPYGVVHKVSCRNMSWYQSMSFSFSLYFI